MKNLTVDNEAIAKRLRKFGVDKYDKIKIFAENLDMNPSSLQSSYLSGRNAPGALLLVKLVKLGCDIEWLLTGKEREVIKENQKLKAENQQLKERLEGIKKLANKT